MPPAATPPQKPLFSTPVRHLIGVFAALWGLVLGFVGGEALAYAIAGWTARDIAEIKDMLIWSTFAGALAGAMIAVWLALVLLRSSAEARKIGLVFAVGAVLLDAGLMAASFDWPKKAGSPEVMYEIRLPAGAPQPKREKVDVVLWAEKTGKGCYVAGFRREDDRPVISGNFTLASKSGPQTLSLRLDRDAEGHWRLSVRPDAKPEKTFGPWQKIEFITNPREKAPPLPPGEYEVRYRVKKYL